MAPEIDPHRKAAHNHIHNRTIWSATMSTISANDLKTKGVSAIEAALASEPEAAISVRGKERFVVMDVAHYRYLRECELEAALLQTRSDLADGRFIKESADAHLARMQTLINPKTSA